MAVDGRGTAAAGSPADCASPKIFSFADCSRATLLITYLSQNVSASVDQLEHGLRRHVGFAILSERYRYSFMLYTWRRLIDTALPLQLQIIFSMA